MMSAKNRVNPDYYKLAGRDPQDRIPPLRDKQLFARQHAMDGGPAGTFIPGGGHAPGAMGMKQGMASGSKKAATSHSGTRSMASTRPVAGAFGREGAGPGAKRKTKSATTPTKARGTKRTTKKARGKAKRAA
jgi:hypothetical protein